MIWHFIKDSSKLWSHSSSNIFLMCWSCFSQNKIIHSGQRNVKCWEGLGCLTDPTSDSEDKLSAIPYLLLSTNLLAAWHQSSGVFKYTPSRPQFSLLFSLFIFFFFCSSSVYTSLSLFISLQLFSSFLSFILEIAHFLAQSQLHARVCLCLRENLSAFVTPYFTSRFPFI